MATKKKKSSEMRINKEFQWWAICSKNAKKNLQRTILNAIKPYSIMITFGPDYVTELPYLQIESDSFSILLPLAYAAYDMPFKINLTIYL